VYGFLALKADRRTVAGVSFYKHGETPGLGGECEKPAFTGQFTGKVIAGADNQPAFGVAKGKASANTCKNFGGVKHCVDGLSGATITGNGITTLINRGVTDYGRFLGVGGEG
jgi:Na+-transporting NADH:ubiquinone oxidoreductase subunit C